MKYYKHIDGLRAIAVLSVVFFHLDVSWVKSGFLGVDIFFVISGFLITGIIIRDLESESFSLKNFYLRRMRRILPALITVLIFSTIFAWIVLLPQDLKNYSKSLVSALGSFSNLYFFKTLGFGYFSTDATVIPLLHTWSLGIEEQFYIFWPLFLIFTFNIYIKIGWKNKQLLILQNGLILGCIFLFLISLLCFVWKDSVKYYYFPVTRAFELLFGCFIAIYAQNERVVLNKITANVLSFVAFILIIIPIFFVRVYYPGLGIVEVCLGTSLFIYVGLNVNSKSLMYKVFSIKPMVAVGLISYSLYLWHWPIIAYCNYMSIEKTYFIKCLILAISFLLSVLTYFLIEKPFRYKLKVSFCKTFAVLLIVPMVLACFFALSSKYVKNFGFNQAVGGYIVVGEYDGFLAYQYPGWQKKIDSLYNYKSIVQITDYQDAELRKLITKKYDVVILGDSHAIASASMINNWTKDLGLSSLMIGGTQLVIKDMILNNTYKGLMDIILKRASPKIFILAGWWDAYTENALDVLDNKQLYFINDILQILKNNKISPIILLDWPSLKGEKPICGMTRLNKIVHLEQEQCGKPLSEIIASQKIELNYINELKRKYQELTIIDPKKIICEGEVCINIINEHIIYMNSIPMQNGLNNAHLNEYGSSIVGKLYLERYGNPLKINSIL